MPRNLHCPICRQPVARTNSEFPFCSQRCRSIDLGNWASGRYVIHSPVNDPEAIENEPSDDERDDG